MSHVTAYALMMFDSSVNPPRVIGVDVFSEKTPTLMGYVGVLDVSKGEGDCYEDALADLFDQFNHNFNIWIKNLLVPHAVKSLEEASGRTFSKQQDVIEKKKKICIYKNSKDYKCKKQLGKKDGQVLCRDHLGMRCSIEYCDNFVDDPADEFCKICYDEIIEHGRKVREVLVKREKR